MSDPRRHAIRDILERWERGEIDADAVHGWAEARWLADGHPERPKSDARSIADEVLCQLDVLNHQWIIPEDIAAILRFLETAPGRELQGWEEWAAYWRAIDYEQRQRELAGVWPYTAS